MRTIGADVSIGGRWAKPTQSNTKNDDPANSWTISLHLGIIICTSIKFIVR